jgi:hypothetical protein
MQKKVHQVCKVEEKNYSAHRCYMEDFRKKWKTQDKKRLAEKKEILWRIVMEKTSRGE